MFGRFNEMMTRIKLGETYRYQRSIAGKITGVFFFISSICKVPMQNFAAGTVAVSVTFFASLYTFLTKTKENYAASDPAIADAAREISEKNKYNSMALILMKIRSQKDRNEVFFKKYSLDPDTLAKLENLSQDELEKICMDLFNNVYSTYFRKIEKYSVSIINFAEEIVGNFLELILANTFAKYEPYELDEGLSNRNLIFLAICMLALYHGYQTYLETKKSYEEPTPELLTKALLTEFNKRPAPTNDTTLEESTPLLGLVIPSIACASGSKP